MSDDALVLGLDLGISTAKAALFSPDGGLIALESEEYLIIPEGSRVEADPEVYWTPVVHSIRRLLANWGGDVHRIRAVSVSSHAETVIPVAADGQPSRPAIVWMDNRSQAEVEELVETVGRQRVLEISGQPELAPLWPVTRYRWLSRHEPEIARRTAKYLLPEDYLLFRLSGEFVGEQTLWSSSLVYDIRKKAISGEMMDFGCVTEDKLPRILPPATAIGRVSARCSQETGLSSSTIVVTGALDQLCSAIAAGNTRPGIVTESTGSVLALVATIADPIFDAKNKMPCHIHAVPGLYCLLPWNPTGGLALKWFKDRLAERDAEVARSAGQDIYTLLSDEASRVPLGSNGLVMLPHLEGAYFPEFNAAARAVFFGFTLKHSRGHFVRAIMEAVAFMIRRDLEGIRQLGVEPREIRVLGGGAKSQLWSQIKADVCRLPVVVPKHGEAAVLGAAILAAVGARLHEDIPTAVHHMAHEGDRLMPGQDGSDAYERVFALYVALYETVKGLFALSGALDPIITPTKEN